MSQPETNADFYIPGGEPFFYKGGAVGCLCLHGLQAMPQEVRWLGQHLADRGYTVYGPRLAGHGTDITDLRRVHWRDWYGSALDAYRVLRQQCERVFVAGLSMGGLLSLCLGAREKPDGIACLAGPLELDQPLLPYAHRLKTVWRYTSQTPDANHLRIDKRMRALQAERQEPVIGRASYGYFPIAALAQLYDLQQETRARLAGLTAPLLLVYSEGDPTVPFRNLDLVESLAGTPPQDRHTLRLTESGHLLTLDVEMEQVFAAVGDFVARYAGQSG